MPRSGKYMRQKTSINYILRHPYKNQVNIPMHYLNSPSELQSGIYKSQVGDKDDISALCYTDIIKTNLFPLLSVPDFQPEVKMVLKEPKNMLNGS